MLFDLGENSFFLSFFTKWFEEQMVFVIFCMYFPPSFFHMDFPHTWFGAWNPSNRNLSSIHSRSMYVSLIIFLVSQCNTSAT